jgi:hypothetical protein
LVASTGRAHGAQASVFTQQVKENKEETTALAEQAARWVQLLVNALDEVKTDAAALERMRPNVQLMFEWVDCWIT